MAENILGVSRSFFGDVVRPPLEKHFPRESEQMACGMFGYGSEFHTGYVDSIPLDEWDRILNLSPAPGEAPR